MISKLVEQIKNPPREFTPIPFWFWNDALTEDEIIRQLKDFHQKGVDGVVLHPRLGIPESIPYLSDIFMHYVKVAVETAASLGMYVVLYDEAMYPSGSAHGLVAAEDPRFASQAIILSDDDSEGKLITRCKSGKYLVQVPSDGRIRGIHFGEDDGEERSPLAADLLSQDAVDCFIRITHERYKEVVGEYFGSTILGFFTDEPSLLGRINRGNCKAWTWGFEEEFVALGGVLEDLEGLFTGEENESTKLYKKAVFEREQRIYYGSLHRFCEENGVSLMGHPHAGDDIECEKYFHVPGQDLVWRCFGPESPLSGKESAQGKCSSDAARIHNRRRNSNECFGVCVRDSIPWYFPGGDMKWYFDYLGVRGVNLFIPHAFYYSVRGARKDERPPDVGPNNIWWEHYETIATYVKRMSYIMTDSVNEARVCVLCENRNMHVDEVRELYENQVEFNYLPYSDFREDMVRNGKLTVGNNTYDYVFCDDRNRVGIQKIRGINDLKYRDIYTDTPCPGLRISRLKKDGVRMVFLTNEGNDPIETDASLDGEASLIAMNLWTGSVWQEESRIRDGKTRFSLKLGVRESLLLILDEHGDFKADATPIKAFMEIDFSLISDDTTRFVKTYRGVFNGTAEAPLWIRVQGEEMVECFVNGAFAGFSLWNPHEFKISDHLICGENEIILKVTGNAANRFTEHRIEYGLL
ncbi:MAG: hypothetical protein J6B86_01520 [Clostridia bacterium]|nr:hypothetical protein [Clostridia bacterium]